MANNYDQNVVGDSGGYSDDSGSSGSSSDNSGYSAPAGNSGGGLALSTSILGGQSGGGSNSGYYGPDNPYGPGAWWDSGAQVWRPPTQPYATSQPSPQQIYNTAQSTYQGIPQSQLPSWVQALYSAFGQGGTNPNTPLVPPTVPGAITPAHRQALQQAGYGDFNNPALTEAAYNQIANNAQQEGNFNQAAQNAAKNAQDQFDLAQKKQQQDMLTTLTNSLFQNLNTANGPALVNTLNGILGQLGVTPIGTSAGPGVLPTDLTPAEWDAMPAAVQQQVLQAWSARGGDTKSFLAAIDAQRPHGPQYTGGMVHYGNVAA